MSRGCRNTYAPEALICFIVPHTDLGLQQFFRANHYGRAFERRGRKIPEYRRDCARSHQSFATASGWGVRLGVRPVPVFDHMGQRSGMSDSHIVFFLLLCRKTCKSLLQIADGSHLRDTAYTWPTTSVYPEAKPLDYALIGGFNFSIAVLVAPLTTRLTRLFGIKTPMFIGCLLLSGGFFGASFATDIWQLYLSQGIAVGLGVNFIYLLSTAVIPQWFAKRRSVANGICAAGSGVGGCIMCLATQAMINSVSYRWSLRISALIAFFVNLLALLLIRSRNEVVQPTQRSFDFRLLKRYHVLLLLAWCVIVMFGYITLMFSLADYTTVIGFASDSATVAALLNLGAAIGRPMFGYASDRLGVVEVTAVLTFVSGMLCFALWIPATSFALLVVFALLSGAVGVFWAVRPCCQGDLLRPWFLLMIVDRPLHP